MSSNRGTSIRRSVQKEGLQLLLGEPRGGCLSPSPHPSDTRPLGWVVCSPPQSMDLRQEWTCFSHLLHQISVCNIVPEGRRLKWYSPTERWG